MSWITFETVSGGLVVAQLRHIIAIYDEQGQVKLATVGGGEHILKDVSVQRAAARVSASSDSDGATVR
jgi:hypothetical protein